MRRAALGDIIDSATGLAAVGTTTQYHELGSIYVQEESSGSSVDGTDSQGPREWIYIKNGEASTAMALGEVIMRKASDITYVCQRATTTAPPAMLVGIAQSAIAAGSYGWIMRKGMSKVLADGTLTANTPVKTSTSVAANATSDNLTQTAMAWGHNLGVDPGVAITAAAQIRINFQG